MKIQSLIGILSSLLFCHSWPIWKSPLSCTETWFIAKKTLKWSSFYLFFFLLVFQCANTFIDSIPNSRVFVEVYYRKVNIEIVTLYRYPIKNVKKQTIKCKRHKKYNNCAWQLLPTARQCETNFMSKNCVLENKTDGNKSLVSKVQHKKNLLFILARFDSIIVT